MLKRIKNFLFDPTPEGTFEEIEPGRALLDGTVFIEEPLRSPVKGAPCAAYFYRAFLVIDGGRAPAIHKLKQAEVYAPFVLKMDGGEIAVHPPGRSRFDRDEHLALSRQYTKGFQGIEEIVPPGARVRVKGRIRRHGDHLEMRLRSVTVLEERAQAKGATGNRKNRRRKNR